MSRHLNTTRWIKPEIEQRHSLLPFFFLSLFLFHSLPATHTHNTAASSGSSWPLMPPSMTQAVPQHRITSLCPWRMHLFWLFFLSLRQKTRALASVIATDLNLVVWFMFSLRGLCDNSFLQTWGCCCDKETNEISRTCYEVIRSEFAKNAICGSWSYFRNTSSCSRL